MRVIEWFIDHLPDYPPKVLAENNNPIQCLIKSRTEGTSGQYLKAPLINSAIAQANYRCSTVISAASPA